MKLQDKKHFILLATLVCFFTTGKAQELKPYRLTLDQTIELGLQNHQQLKISAAQVDAAEQQLRVSKSQQLPTVTFSANAFYLGDALLLDTDGSKIQTVDMPHFGNTYSLQVSQLLYKGGVIRKSIEMAELQKQLVELDRTSNGQDIKLLIISNYLDISKLINQRRVLEQNKVLAEQLLENITKLYEQDMVTRNEIIRAELQIKNLDQTILAMKNNHAILSNQLSYALGLPDNILIIPMEMSSPSRVVQPRAYYTGIALERHPGLLSAEKNVEIADKNVSIQKGNRSPGVSGFGGYTMQRPLTSSTPVLDIYNNTWQASR